jgi:hypothetical protein
MGEITASFLFNKNCFLTTTDNKTFNIIDGARLFYKIGHRNFIKLLGNNVHVSIINR